MKAPSTVLSLVLLTATPLLFSTLASSTPVDNKVRRSQIVLSDVEEATRLDPNTQRQGDLVDSMIAEAQAKGQDLSAWGISSGKDVEGKVDEVVEESLGPFFESVDLSDAVARAKLLWEAALDDTLVTIQPISSISKQSAGFNMKKAQTQKLHATTSTSATAGPPGSGWIWQVCGSGQEAAVLEQLNVLPDPPVAGQNLTVRAKGIVNSPIHEGTYADVVVKLGFIRLLSKRFDICQLAEENDADVKCPVEPGEYELVHTVELPKEIPPAKFNVHVSGKTQDGVDFVCTDLSIDFQHH